MKRNFYALALLALTSVGATAQTVWDLSTTGLPNRNIANYIHAPSADVCVATVRDSVTATVVPKVVVTTDGGVTWAIKTLTNVAGLTPSSIWAKDASTIFVPMYNGTAGGGKLMRTTDGGTTWAAAAPLAYTNAAAFPNIVAFTDAMTGITMGDPVGGYFEIHRTTDGGNTWTRIPQVSIAAPVSGEYGLTDIYGVNGNNIWFGTNMGRVYHSADAGLTWTAASTHYQALAYSISGVAMENATTGYAYSSGGTAANPNDDLAKTTDGGATWTAVATTGIGFAGRGDMKWMKGTPNTYFVSGSSQCKYSYDGGSTWVATTETNGNTSFSGMAFPAADKGYAASNYYTGPIAIWNGPALAPACVSILDVTQTGHPEMCSGDSVSYWVRVDNAADPLNTVALRYQTRNDAGVWSAAQTVNMSDLNIVPTFTPDGGMGTIGTLAIADLSLSNRFSTTNFNEVTRWRVQIVPSACPVDTSTGAAYNNVNLDIVGDAAAVPPVPGCATTVVANNTITVDFSACNKTPAILSYNVVGYFLDGATTPVQGSSYTATSGTHTLDFGVDNGTCFQIVSGSITFSVPVATDNKAGEANGRLYPNPATDLINVTAVNKATAVRIFDVTGKLVTTQNITVEGNVTTIPTNTLTAGVYFLQTVDAQGNAVARYRFVKQ